MNKGTRDKRRNARPEIEWQVALRRAAATVAEPGQPPVRPLILLAVESSRGLVVHSQVVAPDAGTDTLVEGVVKALQGQGVVALPGQVPRPQRIRSSDPGLARALQEAIDRLDGPSIRVVYSPDVPLADRAVAIFNEHLTYGAEALAYWPRIEATYPDMGGLMHDAAAYFTCGPWNYFSDEDIIDLRYRGRWRYGSIMGAGGQLFGLALFLSARGVHRVLEASDGSQPSSGNRGPRPLPGSLYVTFDDGSDYPPMIREHILSSYPVADAAAVPFFGRVRNGRTQVPGPADLDVLRAALQAIPRFLEVFFKELQAYDAAGDRDVVLRKPLIFQVPVHIRAAWESVELRWPSRVWPPAT
ncbi:MAG TPA: hypothetical protein VIL95_07900 [Bacillota bacterium]